MVQTVENPPCVPPTLYETIRLARIVNEVTRQLKIRVQNKRLPSQIRSAIDKHTKPQRSHRSREGNLRPLDGHWELAIHRDINKLNIVTPVGQLSQVAAEDSLFLSATCTLPENSVGFTQLQHCRTALCRLRAYKRWHKRPKPAEPPQSDVLGEKYIANIEHLLLRYIHDLYLMLHNLVYLRVVVEIHLWSRRILDQGWWFLEWPNGRRPLSSTWPWNIKSSLIVLWGVCWMFANYETNGFESDDQIWEFYGTQDQQAQPISRYLNPSPQHGQNFGPLTDPALVSAPQSSDEAITGSRHQPSYGFSDPSPIYNTGSIYLPVNPNAPPQSPRSPFRGSPGIPYPDNPGHPTSLPRHSLGRPQISRPSPPHVTRRTRPYTQNTVQPAQLAQSPIPQRNRHLREHPSSPQIDTLMHVNTYPVSPEPEDPSPRRIFADPSSSPATTKSSPSPSVSLVRKHASSQRRERAASKDEKGRYVCGHDGCVSEQIAFIRKCEWSKHMDKHDRPYPCSEPGCEKLQGFTYPGGLLRHEREVHKKHGGPKEELYCPHSTCKRSSGQGFTRRENYNEHLRRVHKEGDEKRDDSPEGDDNSEPQIEVGRKRKRKSVTSVGSDSVPVADDSEYLRKEVKRLRRENEGMKNRLQRLEELLQPHHLHSC
ncbi:MAG: hypothetical protein M1840_005443 [Geoglossum simile]|nr:MAG: hypothetical protein M1840_005443 [Geoglossum simile]